MNVPICFAMFLPSRPHEIIQEGRVVSQAPSRDHVEFEVNKVTLTGFSPSTSIFSF